MPKDFFNLAIGGQLLGEKDGAKVASNVAALVKSGGRLLTLEGSQPSQPDFAATPGGSFSEVTCKDVSDEVRSALVAALEKVSVNLDIFIDLLMLKAMPLLRRSGRRLGKSGQRRWRSSLSGTSSPPSGFEPLPHVGLSPCAFPIPAPIVPNSELLFRCH